MKKPDSITSLIRSLLFLIIVFSFSACSRSNKATTNSEKRLNHFTFPKITILSNLSDTNQPKKILLDTVAKPLVIPIPVKKGSSYIKETKDGPKVIQLSPPVTHTFINNITHLPENADVQGTGFFTAYTTDNGLALDEIYCSFKDKMGNLWFGTNGGGVSKYNGKNFINYTSAQGLAQEVIWQITEDHSGNIWFATDGSGACKYDGKIFTNYTKAQGLANNVVFDIKEDKKGNLWFGTDGAGVSKYDGKIFTNYTKAQGLADDTVRCILEDKKGNLWFGTDGGGVSKYDGKNFTNYTKTQGLAGDTVRCITEDKNGNLWFGTNQGISNFNGTNFINYSPVNEFVKNLVWCIMEDRIGNLWIGTSEGGVSKFDGKSFINYSTAQGLGNNATVRSIVEDRTGNLWFSTSGEGIYKFGGKSFTNFTTIQMTENSQVYSISEDKKGNLWFGTFGGGVNKYDGKSFTNFTAAQGLSRKVVYSVAKDKSGNLWFGTHEGGINKYDGKSFTNFTTAQGLAGNIVYNIVEDRIGNLWFGTFGGGVSKYDGKSFINFTAAQGLAGNIVYTITEDRTGNLWFGALGGGVSKYDGESFTNFTTDQGLANNNVWTITEDEKGNFWFGTQEGLSLLRKETLTKLFENINKKDFFTEPLFENYTTKDGLPDNYVTQVLQGSDNKLYIGTNQGFCELLSGKNETDRYVVGKVFNTKTGYPVKDVNVGPGAMYKDSKGIIWIGTGSDKTGLVRFDPTAIVNANPDPPSLVIQGIKINNETICWNDLVSKQTAGKSDSTAAVSPNITEEITSFGRQLSDVERDSIRKKFGDISFTDISKWYPIPENLVLPYKHNNIGFDFNAIETGRNFLVKYQYMLQGYDKDWSPPSNVSSASFGNIHEGTYTFKLKALSPDGIWSKPVEYTFKVLPPWWRTWWMYIVYVILIVAVLISSVWWNNRRIIAQKKKLEHKVTVATKQIREEKNKVEEQKKKIEETLSELKSTQAQLIQSEKMASLGELTAGIAHEIQNPLNFVNNFSEVNEELIEELKTEKLKPNNERNEQSENELLNDISQNLQKINFHGKRADAIVKSMLQHSRKTTGQKELADINALADEYLRLAYHGLRAKDKSFNAKMATDFDPTLEKINIVPQEIGRVILNLINNAFYAVSEKQKACQAEHVEAGYEPTVTVSTKKIENKVEIKIKDNGNGIPQKILDKIFQPFFTTKPSGQGTGLGLSLSYDIVTKGHGGEFKVETTEGEGSEFIVLLPENSANKI